MSLRRLPVLEIKKVYVDSLAEWVEVPVFEQEEIIKFVNEIDWDGLDMGKYKKILIDHWPLPLNIKAKLKNPAARDDLYEALVQENWGLRPSEISRDGPYYTAIERNNVELWFASNKVKGRPPDVLK